MRLLFEKLVQLLIECIGDCLPFGWCECRTFRIGCGKEGGTQPLCKGVRGAALCDLGGKFFETQWQQTHLGDDQMSVVKAPFIVGECLGACSRKHVDADLDLTHGLASAVR